MSIQLKSQPNWGTILDSIVKVLGQTAGKDKIAKILQYGGKLLAHLAQKNNAKSDWVNKAKKVEASAGGARKVFRLGNELTELQKARAVVKAGNLNDPLNFLALMRAVGNYWYWIFDHLVWAGNTGLAPLDVAKHSYYSSVSWFIALASAILLDFHALRATMHKQSALHAKYEQHRGDEVAEKEMREVQSKKNELLLNCVKNFADLGIAANLLNFYKFSQGKVGAFGLISAFIAFYQLWPASAR